MGRARASAGGRARLLAAVADFLVEPVDPPRQQGLADAWTPVARPVVAVAGLVSRCGTTTVARALAAELALRDPDGAAVVTTDVAAPPGGVPLGMPAAARLARVVSRSLVAHTRAVGRVCLTACAATDASRLTEISRELAPLVLDVADPAQAGVAASLADAVVLVGTPSVEPALAAVLAESIDRVGPEPVVVLNRLRTVHDADPWDGRCSLQLPESRMGARLALAGREPHGRLGRGIAGLADLVTAP